ncbi:hypothetical protein M3Y95_01053900 [Aphelenchoides besseyi]|nr:hypothetical protein M3Y95_01053900 [Aphelenchoides besseyi]
MVLDGRFIGCSLICLLAFGFGLLASDPKCFEESGDKTVLKGDCKGSEVLVVKSQELKVHFKSVGLCESEQTFEFTFGGYKIDSAYKSIGTGTIISFGSVYNMPVNITITPEKYVVTDKISPVEYEGSFKFEQNGETYKIKVDYDPKQSNELGSLMITFDATIFVEEQDNTKAKIMWAAIAVLVILVAIIIVLLVIYCCCINNKKSKKPTQPPQSTPAAIWSSSEPKVQGGAK